MLGVRRWAKRPIVHDFGSTTEKRRQIGGRSPRLVRHVGSMAQFTLAEVWAGRISAGSPETVPGRPEHGAACASQKEYHESP